MYFIYLDESGNTGCNLNDSQQPVFVLTALIVPVSRWQQLEVDLQTAIRDCLGSADETEGFEVHGTDLRNGRGHFTGRTIEQRMTLRDRWFSIAHAHDLKIVYRAIEKKRFKTWVETTFGKGVAVNPHVAAFPLVARVIDEYLAQLPGQSCGTFISDENLEVARDVEKSLRFLRGTQGVLRLNHIIEKGFFIDSQKSLPLQLCDVCALALRKLEEAKAGYEVKPIDKSAADPILPLIHRGNERLLDVIRWLTDERKK